MNHIYDIPEMLRRASGRIEEILISLYPGCRIKRAGTSFKMGNINGDPGDSFAISAKPTNAGCFYDHADPTVSGDLLALVSHRRNVDRRGAMKWLGDFVGLLPQESFEAIKKPKVESDLEKKLHPLHDRTIRMCAARKISKEVLERYRVGSSVAGSEMLLPHYDENEQLGMIQFRPVTLKKESPWTNESPFFTLFGKHLVDPNKTNGELIITEGHWDAMSWDEVGIPAVSIPSGAENHKWIENDYHWLNQFTTIFLNYDNDEVGQKAASEVMRRLGPDRCKILKLPRKDANDHLKAGEGSALTVALENARTSPMPELVVGELVMPQILACLKGDHTAAGTPCFFPSLPIRFRLHEWTLWFGYTSHGKSAAVGNQIAYEAGIQQPSLVASFEQTPQQTYSNIALNLTADPGLHNRQWNQEALRFMMEYVRLYNSMKRVNPDALIRTFIAAHCQLGIKTFAIDNVMTLDVDRQDNTVQAEVADKLRVFVATYPVHLHCVAHPRKQKDNATAPPNISEVRGASEWVDMPHNVITVFRSMEKHERIADMQNGGIDAEEILAYDQSTPDGRFYVRKQRETGEVPIARFWFHKPSKRFMEAPGEPRPWWIPSEEPSNDPGR